ncbi:MAG: ABC transporter permease [Ruminococcaceae bacterium]|nr:ABC transporter permease [Oscillospiraceae bacterium]
MGKYIVKRILYILVVFLILSLMIFLIYNMLPVDKAMEKAREEAQNPANRNNPNFNIDERYAFWQEKLGLNGNKFERYLRWLGVYPYVDGTFNGLLQGNLGESFKYARPVSEVLVEPMKNTIFINIFATILALGITIPLGIFCAVKRGSKRDLAVQVGTVIGYSLPTFIIAIVFIWLFSVTLEWFPVSGMATAGSLDWSPAKQFWDKMYHLCLPLMVMTFCSLGGMTRYVRASMTEALSMDCIRTARAKGLREKTVVYSHAWKNALIPIVTLVIGWFLGIFSGSLMIENIFSLNGVGKVYFDALQNNDNDIVLALQMFYIFISLAGNLLIDIAYGFVDPRVRVNK